MRTRQQLERSAPASDREVYGGPQQNCYFFVSLDGHEAEAGRLWIGRIKSLPTTATFVSAWILQASVTISSANGPR